MNALALGLPLALPTLAVASRAAAGGLGLLQSLVSPQPGAAKSMKETSLELVSFQRSVADHLSRGGLGAALPLELGDNGQGGMSVLSDSPSGAAIEQRLNADPFLLSQFRSLANGAAGLLRVTIPATSGLDAVV